MKQTISPINISYESPTKIDANDLCNVDKNNDIYPWKLPYFNDNYQLLIAKNNQKLCGFIIYNTIDIIEILRIVVVKKYRNKGIATHFIRTLQQKNTIILEVREDNYSAISLYKKCDFKIINIRKNYYGNTVNALIMKYNKL